MKLLLVDLVLALPLIGAYAVFGLGIVVTYQASRVLNLAHGAMAMFPAYLAYEATKRGLPVVLGLPVGAACGAALGLLVERFVLRPLRSRGPTVQTVGTVAVLGMLIAIAAKLFGTTATRTPSPFPPGSIEVGESTLHSAQIGLFFTAIVVTAAFFALFRFTDLGMAMRGAAQNRRAASLMGVNPNRTTTMAWLLAGATAGLGGVLVGAANNLEPYNLSLQVLPAYVAALIGGLGNLPGVLIGSIIVGGVLGAVPAFGELPILGELARQSGAPQVFLTVVTFIVLARRGETLVAGDARAEGA
ncbi:MAG TPA: branched-chain amino acid ABC transporter permease [Acidimicrobiales bacterium]|nr:branched-chain amino acid ABC transporter permease [Acidimicrobiales bacterium]